MKTSISPIVAALSRSNRMVDAGRGVTASGVMNLHSFRHPEGAARRPRLEERKRIGLMVRDARRRAPHHEELASLPRWTAAASWRAYLPGQRATAGCRLRPSPQG